MFRLGLEDGKPLTLKTSLSSFLLVALFGRHSSLIVDGEPSTLEKEQNMLSKPTLYNPSYVSLTITQNLVMPSTKFFPLA